MRGLFRNFLALLASGALFIGCTPEPQPVQFGSDQCEYCRMIITEPEFASQILNKQGRSFKFDSIECMSAHDLTTDDHGNNHSHLGPDFKGSYGWLKAQDAYYLHSETLRSPMGLYLSAYADQDAAGDYREEYHGVILDWNNVKELVRKEWLSNPEGRVQSHGSH
jgi:copper chaperone NosL